MLIQILNVIITIFLVYLLYLTIKKNVKADGKLKLEKRDGIQEEFDLKEVSLIQG